MSGKMYGYARVSTKAQKEDRQLAALTQFGVAEEDIVVEKQSGKDFERLLYHELLEKMCAHDVLVVKSIDRLGQFLHSTASLQSFCWLKESAGKPSFSAGRVGLRGRL